LTNSLKALSQQKNVTMFILTLAAVVALLYRYTGKEDIGLCSPVANRDFPATKEVIGWFANMLVLRFDLTGINTFSELLEQVRIVALEAYEHHEVPFAVLYHATATPDETSAPCVRFNMLAETKSPSQAQDMPLEESPFSRLEVTPLGVPRPSPLTKQPGIAIDLGMFKGGLVAVAFYEIKRYPVPLIRELLKNYLTILEEIVAEPDKRLSDFTFVVGSR
jgi:non-ribosomal peptide synthetase component F